MSNIKPPPSIGAKFFDAARALQNQVNKAIKKVQKEFIKNKIFGISNADLWVLHAVFEHAETCKDALKIAVADEFDKPAFIRSLKSLEKSGMVMLVPHEEGRSQDVSLTEEGLRAGKIIQDQLNEHAKDILQSEIFEKLCLMQLRCD